MNIIYLLLLWSYLFIPNLLIPTMSELGISLAELKWLLGDEDQGKVCRLIDIDFCLYHAQKSVSDVYEEALEVVKEAGTEYTKELCCELVRRLSKGILTLFGKFYTLNKDTLVSKLK